MFIRAINLKLTRAILFYRAGSTESEHPFDSTSSSFGLKKNSPLQRKSLSLEQTSAHPSSRDQVCNDLKIM